MQKRPSITFIPKTLGLRSPFLAEIGNLYLYPYNENIAQTFHDCTEFVYCHSGKGCLRHENLSFEFKQGDIIYLSPYMSHYIHKIGSDTCRCEFIHVNLCKMFDPEIFKDIIALTEQLQMPFSIPPVLPGYQYPQLKELITLLLDEMVAYLPYLELSIQGYCMCLTAELRKIWQKNREQRKDTDKTHLYQALIYMNKHFNEELSIAQLAEICNLSETHFRRLFKDKFSMSPLKYLNLIRIREACTFLSRKSLLISEAAELAGFQTLSSFNRKFKEVMGLTPTEWVNHLIETEDTPQVKYFG